MQENFAQYVSRMEEIRRLSSPELNAFDDAEDYSARLLSNFEKIGRLAGENREMLDRDLYPLLDSGEELTEEQIEEMMSFGGLLLSAKDCENLDLPVTSLLSNRLMRDAEFKQDLCNLIRQLDTEIGVCYSLMNMTERILTCPEIAASYRNKGFEAGNFFLSLLEKEQFAAIPDEECRELVLTNSRYTSVFYEGITGRPQENERNLELLERMLAISEDPFYRELVPDFDWRYFVYRTLEYYAFSTDYCNQRQFTEEQLGRIFLRTEQLRELWYSDPEYFGELNQESYVNLLCVRNEYLAGRFGKREYQTHLLQILRQRDRQNYETNGLFENLLGPLEYFCTLNPRMLASEEKANLKILYQDITAYVFHSPKDRSLSFMLEFFSGIIERFIEVPSSITFEDMVLQCLAALHPPTYVHSMMVGQLTECMCGHLLARKPELLIGVCGCRTAEEVCEHWTMILSYAYHAARCHDFGKIPIMDTIYVYGRKLLDFEFDIIKQHPRMGYELLMRYESTQAYAEVALGHHRWYDNSKGYPEDFDTSESPVKTIIDLVLFADCMDAATDRVGRSYSKGMTLEEFLEELKVDGGTRYAPWLSELLAEEEVRRDIDYLLTTGRQQTYRDTYVLLRNVQEKGREKERKRES